MLAEVCFYQANREFSKRTSVMTNKTTPTNDAASDFCKAAGFKDGFFEIEGVKLHYVEAGSGPLIIFYHGFPLFWFSFHHQMSALQDRYRVVAVDGLGINLSAKPDDLSQYKLPNLAHHLDQLAKHFVGDERFYLVGHDWGGALAWSFAQYYPHRLHRVVGINAPPTNQLLGLLESNPDQQRRSAYMYSMRSGKVAQTNHRERRKSTLAKCVRKSARTAALHPGA